MNNTSHLASSVFLLTDGKLSSFSTARGVKPTHDGWELSGYSSELDKTIERQSQEVSV
jgi:hypothetical protein